METSRPNEPTAAACDVRPSTVAKKSLLGSPTAASVRELDGITENITFPLPKGLSFKAGDGH